MIEQQACRALCALCVLALLGAGCSAPRDTDDAATPSPGVTSGGVSASAGTGGMPATSASGTGGRASPAAGTSGSASDGGRASVGGTNAGSGGMPAQPPTGTCDYPHDKLVDVTSAGELVRALGSASAGTMIRLPDAELRGAFTATASGTAERPIVLCGTRTAILSANATSAVITLAGDYWVLSGFSVSGGQKGVLLDGASHDLLTSLSVHGTGNEGVHFRANSADNTLEWSEVFDTGNASPEFGEGVYVGSALAQWEKFTGSPTVPDRSDRNTIRNNKLGPNVRAELIDVKEGTTGGTIRDNGFDGAGIAPGGFADSWMDVKGNGYTVTGNQGVHAAADGFQVHVIEDGWGNANVFQKNRADVNAEGYGFRISDGAKGNVVACDNVVTGAAAGLSNIGCKN